MKQAFLPEITYMRGLCMLGVIGIHVGSFALANPQANIQLIGLLEILSRFTVPAFFSCQPSVCFITRQALTSFLTRTFCGAVPALSCSPILLGLFYILRMPGRQWATLQA